jgi:hypothetical protein
VSLLLATAGAAPPVATCPRFASNAFAPQIDVGLAAGFAVLFAVGLASSNTAQAAEYQFGLHAAAIYESQFKGAIWGPPRGTAVVPKPLGVFIQAPEQAYSNAPSWVLASIRGARPQPIILTLGAPQAVDLTLQAAIFKPSPAPQGRTPPFVTGYPQADRAQTPAQLFPSLRAPPVVPNPIAGFVTTLPQFEERTSATIYCSLRSGQTPPRITMIVGSPQSDLPQIPATVWAAARTPTVVAGVAAKFLVTGPQNEDRPTAFIWSSIRAGSRPPRLTSLWAAPQNVDLTIQGAIFTRAASAPVVPTIVAARIIVTPEARRMITAEADRTVTPEAARTFKS